MPNFILETNPNPLIVFLAFSRTPQPLYTSPPRKRRRHRKLPSAPGNAVPDRLLSEEEARKLLDEVAKVKPLPGYAFDKNGSVVLPVPVLDPGSSASASAPQPQTPVSTMSPVQPFPPLTSAELDPAITDFRRVERKPLLSLRRIRAACATLMSA